MQQRGSTRNSKLIDASPEALYRAFTDPEALAAFLAPDDMTGKVHSFDGRPGGGYEMSLYYSGPGTGPPGKSAELEDRFTARFVELTPPERIVQSVLFDSPDPAFAGEMTMTVTFERESNGTLVTIAFEDIPPGIRPEGNEEGTRQTLEKLARYVRATH